MDAWCLTLNVLILRTIFSPASQISLNMNKVVLKKTLTQQTFFELLLLANTKVQNEQAVLFIHSQELSPF